MSDEKKVEDAAAKHTAKDSLFTNLFKEKKYLIQLYRAVHMNGKHHIQGIDVSGADIQGIF